MKKIVPLLAVLIAFYFADPSGTSQLSLIPEALGSHEAAPDETSTQEKAREAGNKQVTDQLWKTLSNYRWICRRKYGVTEKSDLLSKCVQNEMHRDEALGRILIDPITREYEKFQL